MIDCPRLRKRNGERVMIKKYICNMCPYLDDDDTCGYRLKFNPLHWNKNSKKK